jgi:hypothetical protein
MAKLKKIKLVKIVPNILQESRGEIMKFFKVLGFQSAPKLQRECSKIGCLRVC